KVNDGSGTELSIDLRDRRGASLLGRVEREVEGGRIVSTFNGDTEAHRASHSFEASGDGEVRSEQGSTVPAPTRETALAYLLQLVKRGADASQLPPELRALLPHVPDTAIELNRSPAIYRAGGELWRGGELDLLGDFPSGTMRVFFAPKAATGVPDLAHRV